MGIVYTFSSMIFSLIATLVFGVVDVVLRSKNDMYETIIANTRNVLDGEYLIIKGNSNLIGLYLYLCIYFSDILVYRKRE